MAKRVGSVNLKRRIPKLCHTTTRGIGWHVNYRDPQTGIDKKHRFDVETEAEAKVDYVLSDGSISLRHRWIMASLTMAR